MNIENPKICVIIPVYKIKKVYLEECINSIIHQTYYNIEIILVDDCSPDLCGKWCDELSELDNRIIVIHNQKNMGVSESRNIAINKTKSDYVTFVDADDWLDQNVLMDLITSINTYNELPEIVIFQECLNYLNREILPSHKLNRQWKGKSEIIELQKIALSFVFNYSEKRITAIDNVAGKLISVKYLNQYNLRFKKIPYREDGLFFQEIVEKANYIIEVPIGMYHYRMRKDSAVNNFRPNAPIEQKQLLYLHWKFANDTKKDSNYKHILYGFSLIPMQMCIITYFYNSYNKSSFAKKYKTCSDYFRDPLYSQVFHKIRISELNRNFKFKAILIKYKMYYLVTLIRALYMKINRCQFFE